MYDPLEEDFFSFDGEFAAMRKRMLTLMRQQLGPVEWPSAADTQSIPEVRREPRRQSAMIEQKAEIALEVSSDAGRVNVVMPIPWAKEEDITVTPSAIELTVDASGPRGFSKTVPLPHRIKPTTCEHALKNGLLLISAERQRQRRSSKATP
ncbi:MAG: hypothetical protein WCK39_04300 [Methanomassiliicoccales archaeon]